MGSGKRAAGPSAVAATASIIAGPFSMSLDDEVDYWQLVGERAFERLCRPSVAAIEQLANCRNAGRLALRYPAPSALILDFDRDGRWYIAATKLT